MDYVTYFAAQRRMLEQQLDVMSLIVAKLRILSCTAVPTWQTVHMLSWDSPSGASASVIVEGPLVTFTHHNADLQRVHHAQIHLNNEDAVIRETEALHDHLKAIGPEPANEANT